MEKSEISVQIKEQQMQKTAQEMKSWNETIWLQNWLSNCRNINLNLFAAWRPTKLLRNVFFKVDPNFLQKISVKRRRFDLL